ncbi:hypothetical protein [Bacillus coreaensis]
MNTFEKMWLTVFFVELFIGGGGRLIDFGFLSIRQVLFIGLILIFLIRIMKEKAYLNMEVNTFFRMDPISIGVYLLIASFLFSAVNGFINGNPPSIIVMDFFRVSLIVAYFPLAFYVSEKRFSKDRIIQLLKKSAFLVAIFTIMIALLGKTVFSANFDEYKDFWKSIMNDDLLFRLSHSVFYKSHFFVLIGLVLSLNDVLSKRFTKLDVFNIVLGSLSIFWSDTRGLSIALMASIFLIVVIDLLVFIQPIIGWKNKFIAAVRNGELIKKTIVLIVITISVPILYHYTTLERFAQTENSIDSGEVQDTSVGARVEFLLDAKRILLDGPAPFLIGEGYGTSIAGRIDGIEMSFLDIWIEQGAIGLMVWLFLCFIVFYNYYHAYRTGEKLSTLDRSLLGAFFGMLLLTNINPFINNPIGMLFFILMLIFSNHIRSGHGKTN